MKEENPPENTFGLGTRFKKQGVLLLEVLLIVLWGLWIGKEYLDFNPLVVPYGTEYGSVVSSHHFWNAVKECGYCAIWDGTIQGGAPAFADIYTGVFHPVTMIATLLWGVVNGSKVILIASIWAAGLAQYWLAKELRLGRIARVWSVLLVMAGGHLAGRMEAGLVSMVLSTAMCSLIFAAILMVNRRKDARSSVILGLILASAILSGQGYLQVGILMTLPAGLFLLLNAKFKIDLVWKKYVYGAILAILLTAPLLLPFLSTASQISKYTDPEFIHIQPLQFSPLNLVIDDLEFFKSDELSKYPYPNLYVNFIGWVPLILAAFGIALRKEKDKPKLYYLLASTLLVFLFVTPQFFQWLVQFWQGLEKVRLPPYILGIVIAPIVGLAGYGLDRIFERKWSSISLHLDKAKDLLKNSLSLKWLLIIPLIMSVNQAYQFTKSFYFTRSMDKDMLQILDALATEDVQWVQTPFGEHYWIEPAVNMGYKVSPGIRPWRLQEHEPPQPYFEVTRHLIEDGEDNALINEDLPNVFLYQHELAAYARIQNLGDPILCQSTGRNGYLEVTCPETDLPGRLVVKENNFAGWKAWAGEKSVSLVGEDWLEVVILPGVNQYTFQYHPWNVPVGIALFGLGLVFVFWLVKKEGNDLIS